MAKLAFDVHSISPWGTWEWIGPPALGACYPPGAWPSWLSMCGCTSWVQLPVTPTLAAPVHDEAALAEVAARVREAVG